MTRALAAAALLGLGWLIAALALIPGICWALAGDDDEKPKPLKIQPWTSRDDALYRNACKEAA
jgi:hypothetical protein